MRRAFALSILLSSVTISAAQESPTPIDICEVLRNIPKYTDQVVTIRGAVVGYEHGAYLVPANKCGPTEYSGIRINSSPPMPWRTAKGSRHPAVVEGAVSISTRPIPRWSGKPYAVIAIRAMHLDHAR